MAVKRMMAAGAALVVVAAVVGVYGIGGLAGNREQGASCPHTAEAAASLASLAQGEVAAFQIAKEPQNLQSLAFTGPGGKPMTLADLGGKVTLVNLWATWCAPCRQEMPALDRLEAAAGSDDFAVVPVSIDTGGAERPLAFLKEIGVDKLPFYSDPSTNIFNELKKRSLALGLPVTLLIDRNGCHLGHMNGPAEWDSADGQKLIQAAVAAPSAGAPQS